MIFSSPPSKEDYGEAYDVEIYGRAYDGDTLSSWTLLSGPAFDVLASSGEDPGDEGGTPPGGPSQPDDGEPLPVYQEPTEPPGDIDGDDIPDDEDPDIDGDDVPNERDNDMDGDGVVNSQDSDLDGDGVPNANDWGPYDPADRRMGAEEYGIQIGRSVYPIESIWLRKNGANVIIMLLVFAFVMWTQTTDESDTGLGPKKRKRTNGKRLLDGMKR